MTDVFVDTSAWMAVLDAGDVHHRAATAYQEQIADRCRLVVTNYILDELFTLSLMTLGYRRSVDIKHTLDQLHRSGALEVVWVDPPLADAGWSVFERFNQDKLWSFTDCVSFALIRARAIPAAFAFDHHFDQMGIPRQPAEKPA